MREQIHEGRRDGTGARGDGGAVVRVPVSLVKLHASYSDVVTCFGFFFDGSQLQDCRMLELNGEVLFVFVFILFVFEIHLLTVQVGETEAQRGELTRPESANESPGLHPHFTTHRESHQHVSMLHKTPLWTGRWKAE